MIVWTVNEESEMNALAESGVDGIITDYPDRLRMVLARRASRRLPRRVRPCGQDLPTDRGGSLMSC